MSSNPELSTKNVCWVVGVSYDSTENQLPRFLSEGIWENGFSDKHLDLVKSMKVGDRIIAKSSYTRKNNLPFDNKDQTVSVMAIKAIGTITANHNNGRVVSVDWTKIEPQKEWYFHTYRTTIQPITPDHWITQGLVDFAFENKPQDLDRFRNEPNWRERFGTEPKDKMRFGWTRFYEALASKLLDYRHNRAELVEKIKQISASVEGLGHLSVDQFSDGTKGFVTDICPFTTMGLFNRQIKDSNRMMIAQELAKFLGVETPLPTNFEGLPVSNNLTSWFFPFEKNRTADHIDALWDLFAIGIEYADEESEDLDVIREKFAKAYDNAQGRPSVAWNLTIGLFWIRPWSFLSLDQKSQGYIASKLGIPIGKNGPKKISNSADYLVLMDNLEQRFLEMSYPAHSYPELSSAAFAYNELTGVTNAQTDQNDDIIKFEDEVLPNEELEQKPLIAPYSIDDIINEGCFLDKESLIHFRDRLNSKKNLILQGPPGTGKTWLAKRLAFALIGQKDESRIRAVQFHPNLSYEDFVRGWRPSGDGKLVLTDGIFMKTVKSALSNPSSKFVVVIEEINRGNPAQIFGELLTLLEAGKRTPNEALELCYPDEDGIHRPVHIPDNLYVIGTMNLADRSLALVDLALRRRFAFINLEPSLGDKWREWVHAMCNVDSALSSAIESRIKKLNSQIENDSRLGKQFQIGHSYVTPTEKLEAGESIKWFQNVVDTEIGPLLDEYWFDAPEEAQFARTTLTQDL